MCACLDEHDILNGISPLLKILQLFWIRWDGRDYYVYDYFIQSFLYMQFLFCDKQVLIFIID